MCRSYIGPVAVAADASAGGSRGLIVTRDVEAGEILLATKAIAYSTPSDDIDIARALDMRILSRQLSCCVYLKELIEWSRSREDSSELSPVARL